MRVAARDGGAARRSRIAVASRLGVYVDQDAPRLGRADDIGDAIHVGDDDRRAASHAFQQDIGPAFMGRDEQQKVGRAIDLGKAILRHSAEQAHTVGDPALAGQLLDTRRVQAPRRRSRVRLPAAR